MATTELDHACFENGDTMEVVQDSLTILTTPSPPNANETYVARLGWKGGFSSHNVTDADDWLTLGFRWRTTDTTPSANKTNFFKIADGTTGNTDWGLDHTTAGKVVIGPYDVISSVSADTWYKFEIKWNRNASGDIKIWVDDVLQVDLTGASLAGDNNATCKAVWYNNENGPYDYVDGFYWRKDDGANIDTTDTRLLDWYGIRFSDGAATATIELDTGNSLDGGQWADMIESPKNDANYGYYDISTGTGAKEGGYVCDSNNAGPSGHTTPSADDVYLAAKFCWRAQRESGFGAISFFGKWGSIADDASPITTDNTTTTAALLTLSTSWQNCIYHVELDDSTIRDTYFQQGFKASGGGLGLKEARVSEQYITTLLQDVPSSGRLALIDGKALLVN